MLRGESIVERLEGAVSGGVGRIIVRVTFSHLSLSQSARSRPLMVALTLLCAHCVVALRGRMFTPYLVHIRFRQRIFRHCI